MSQIYESYITRIEGHGKLDLNLENKSVHLEIDEGERLFETLVRNHSYLDAPFITSRICGVCPVAHTLASVKGIERALDIENNSIIEDLRKIILAGQIIGSHVLHLFFLALPDYLPNIKNTLELRTKNPKLFQTALDLKNYSDTITTLIGGRHVHPITITPGGFSKFPSKKDLKHIKKITQENMNNAKITAKLFLDFKYPNLKNEVKYLSLTRLDNYEVYDGYVTTCDNETFFPDSYKSEIKESLKPYSSAKFASFKKNNLFVGALARLSINGKNLNKYAAKILTDSHLKFPTYNSFHNNLAQAIEIVHFMEEINELCDKLLCIDSKYFKNTPYKLQSGQGVGAIEAPRGTLYHYYKLNKSGKIIDCDIITPTVQNLSNIESDATIIMNHYNNTNASIKNIEKLVRAYDPCITCSVH